MLHSKQIGPRKHTLWVEQIDQRNDDKRSNRLGERHISSQRDRAGKNFEQRTGRSYIKIKTRGRVDLTNNEAIRPSRVEGRIIRTNKYQGLTTE